MKQSRFAVLAVMVLCLAAMAFGEGRKVKSQMPPVYPEVAKTMHLSGTVRMEVNISSEGAVKVNKVLGGHPLLADAAVKAVERWRYEPGAAETTVISVEFKN